MDFANVKRFFYWDVKSYMLIFLGLVAIYSLYTTPATYVSMQFKAAHFLVAAATCMALSLFIRMAVKKKEFKISKDAAITGLIIAVILDPRNLLVTAGISALAIILKNIIRFEGRPLFNPAALALIVGVMAFKLPLSWWAINIFVIFGIWIVYRMGRIPLAGSFLAVSTGLFLLLDLKQGTLGDIEFYSRYVGSLLFFSFFMLTEPKTTPVMRMSQIVFGTGVAIISFLHAVFLPGLDPLLIGLLIMNGIRPILEKKVR